MISEPVVDPDAGRPSRRPASVSGHGLGREPVCIELSATQIDRVVRAASASGSMSMLLSGLDGMRKMLVAGPKQLKYARLSRSLLSGLLVLASFPADRSYMRVTEAARMLDMSPSTTHRYLATLLVVGLLEQDPRTRQYRLANAD
jgi:IclR helix-turn-helix domain